MRRVTSAGAARAVSFSEWDWQCLLKPHLLKLRASGWRCLAGGASIFHYVSPRDIASASPGHASRTLIPTAVVANLFRSARLSRPRRSADRSPPRDAPTVGDWETYGHRGQAGQETTARTSFPRNSRVQFCIFVHFRLPPPVHGASGSRAPAERLYKTNFSPTLDGRAVEKSRD